ncbi:MAG: HD-GYP domain-containing protein [Ilumatobacteraceae bacterium]
MTGTATDSATIDGGALDPTSEPGSLAVDDGSPAGPPPSGLCVWIPAARAPVVTAIEAAGITVVDDPDAASHAIVSTRLARHRIGEYTALAREAQLPVIVLVHPGGEMLAVEALRGGGRMAIAEGDIIALRSLGEGNSGDDESTDDEERIDSLLEAFEARLGREQAASKANVTMVDPVSGLPAVGALQLRLATQSIDPEQRVRVVSVSIPALAEPARLRLGVDALLLFHRRISTAMRLLCQGIGDLYDIGDGVFVLIAPGLELPKVDQLGRAMAETIEGYMPDGHVPLTVAVGHAGPECSIDLATLRELAGRAETAARVEERSMVLGAGELVRPLATATELEVTLRLAELAAEREGAVARDEVASIAHDISLRLGFESRERSLVRFCAAVADIGRVVLDGAAESQAPEVAAVLLSATAGPTVAAVLRATGAHWDGTGSPEGLRGADIPVAARIIAVAEALVAADYAVETLEAGSDTRFDPTVVRAAVELMRQR